jgi:predicted dehydrogenase
MKEKKIRWGIMGAGRIAAKFASDLRFVRDAELAAIASRNLKKAKDFASDYSIPHAYGSYEELARDNTVDVIYIATPHSHHYENTILCLQHGKAVLCEKPFAINALQAKKMIQTAKRKKLFLMEAVWTKFLPHYIKMQELLRQKKIGPVKNVLINFGFQLNTQAPKRLLDPVLGGGTLLDIGIYNVFMAMSILGKPTGIQVSITRTNKQVDEQCAIQLKYKNGAMAQLFSSFSTFLPTEVLVSGTKGALKLTTRFYEPSSRLELYQGIGQPAKIIPVKKSGGIGYHYEAAHVTQCLKKGLKESPVMSHADTLLLMETLDKIRKIGGIKYKADRI